MPAAEVLGVEAAGGPGSSPETVSPPVAGWVGPGLLVLLAGVGPVLAFSGSGYFPRIYLAALVVVAALGAVVFASGPLPRPSRTALVGVGLFGLFAVWTALSISWAGSPSGAWNETNRTLLYLLGAALVVTALSWTRRGGLLWLSFAVLAGIGLVTGLVLFRLVTSPEPLGLFRGGRLAYPVTYWNGLACLLMMGSWLSLSLSLGRWRRWWLEPLLLAVAVVLVELAVLPQSRGALWAFVLTLPVYLAISPHRFRAVANLALLLAAVAANWSRLLAVYQAAVDSSGPTPVAVEQAITAAAVGLAVTVVLVSVVWALTFAVERKVGPLPSGVRRDIGVGLILVLLVGLGVGIVAVHRTSEGVPTIVRNAWSRAVADQGPAGSVANRFTDVGLNGRLQQWRIAADAFREHPLTGLGAENYEAYFLRHRETDLVVRQAHSRPMELLAELGLPGFLLWVAVLGVAFVSALQARVRVRDPALRAASAGMVLAVLSWVIHGSADWFWQLGGVTWPAVLLLGGMLSASGLDQARPSVPAETVEQGRWLSWTRPLVVVFCLAALLSGLFPYLSVRYSDRAYALATRQPAEALQAARLAGRLDPLSVQPLMAKAVVYEAKAGTDGFREALNAWTAALRREPDNWLLAYRGGLAARDAGRPDLARSLLQRALRLNPREKAVSDALRTLGGR